MNEELISALADAKFGNDSIGRFFHILRDTILELNNVTKELQKRNAMLVLDFRKVRYYVDDSIKELKNRSDMVVRDLKKVRDYVDNLYNEKEISEELPEWIKRGDHS